MILHPTFPDGTKQPRHPRRRPLRCKEFWKRTLANSIARRDDKDHRRHIESPIVPPIVITPRCSDLTNNLKMLNYYRAQHGLRPLDEEELE